MDDIEMKKLAFQNNPDQIVVLDEIKSKVEDGIDKEIEQETD